MVDFKKPTKKRANRTDFDDMPEPVQPEPMLTERDIEEVPKKKSPVRTKALNFRVSEDFFERFRVLAFNKRIKNVELLELAFEAYEASQKES